MKLSHILILAALGILGVTGCHKKDNDELGHHHHEEHTHEGHNHNHEGHSHEGHHHDGDAEDAEGDDVITLSPSTAERFGLQTEKAEPRSLNAVVKVSGTISASSADHAIISTPTAGILQLSSGIEAGSKVAAGAVVATVRSEGMTGGDANRLAKVELDAAKAEYDRIESLYADRLVTLGEYNAAKAAYERAKTAYSAPAATGRIISPISGVITAIDARTGQFVEAGTAIATVAASDRLTLRALVPVKIYPEVSGAKDARIIPGGSDEGILVSELDGKRLDLNSPAAATGGYVPVTFTLRNDGRLFPGQTVDVYLLGSGERRVLAVPTSALAEKQGTYFVYQQLDEDCYRRLPVEIGSSDGKYVEIRRGLAGGENIVTKGVTAVKLAETSGAVPEGHNHSH